MEAKTGELVTSDAQALAAIREDVDLQVATARRFPRSVEEFIQKIDALACRNEETAESMFYSMPRDGKNVVGPSVRFAELTASEWGNLRYGGTPVGEDGGGFIVCRGVAWDLEKNVAVTFDVKRRITKRDGSRYSDDMISTTANAGSAIAMRNVVLRCIPQAYWKPTFEKAREVAVGKTTSFVAKRDKVLSRLSALGVFPPAIFAHLAVAGVNDITPSHLELLIGRGTAIKDGEMTIEAAFPPADVNTETGEITMPQAKAAGPVVATTPAPTQQQAAAPAKPAAAEPKAESKGAKAGAKAAATAPVQPAEPPPPAKPAPVAEDPTDIRPDPNDPSAAFDDVDPPPAPAVEDGPITEDERKAIFTAIKASGRELGIPQIAEALKKLGVESGKSPHVKRSQYAAVMAWAKGSAREPGQEG
jgi:hypothetical protein